jgi:hypothetical protein
MGDNGFFAFLYSSFGRRACIFWFLFLASQGKGGEKGFFSPTKLFLIPRCVRLMNEDYQQVTLMISAAATFSLLLLLPSGSSLLGEREGWVCTMYVWNVGILGANESFFLLLQLRIGCCSYIRVV